MRLAYRAFRDEVLNAYRAERAKRLGWGEEDALPLSARDEMRKQVTFFRNWVRDHLGEILAENPNREQFVRLALGIPTAIPLFPAHWPWWRYLVQWFAPHHLACWHIRAQLSQVRTYEGRDFLYTNVYARLLVHHDLKQFSPALDIVLRKLPVPSWSKLLQHWRMDSEWVLTTYRVGLCRFDEIEPYAGHGNKRTPGWFALMMVREGVVRSRDELEWLRYERSEHFFQSHRDEEQRDSTRAVARKLRRFGIGRQSIAGIYRFNFRVSDAMQLAENLELLCAAGVEDLTAVFAMVGERLWRARPPIWCLIVEVIGAHTSEDIRQFMSLLDSGSAPPAEVVLHLQSLGADLKTMAKCQDLLRSLRNEAEPVTVTAAIDLLVASPHSLSLEQLSKCSEYVKAPSSLAEFLETLMRHGYEAPLNVLAFQACYPAVSAPELDRWLSIVGHRRKGMKPELVADWVRLARSGGHSDAYDYLLAAVPMPDFHALQQAEPLVVFGRGILRYLVEEKSLDSLAALREWYFKARGVHGLKWWGKADDAVFRLLMEDAYQRKNYSFVMHNRSCIGDVLHDRVYPVCGRLPYQAGSEEIAKYHANVEAQQVLELSQLMPLLPVVLEKTGGVLLKSILRSAWEAPEVLPLRIAALSPLIDKLLEGGGPDVEIPDELDEDALSLIYRTTADTVRRAWPHARGHSSDLDWLALESSYPMAWQRSIRSLRSPLERSSLLALVRAKCYADMFDHHRSDSNRFFREIQSKRLQDDARDPWSLAAHLGLLLAAAGDDDEIRHWRARGLEQVAQMPQEGAQAFEFMEQLDKLFTSSLPDALNRNAKRYLSRFAATDAELLAQRLVGSHALSEVQGESERLQVAFELTRENVLAKCQRWVSREKVKFPRGKGGSETTPLYAVLTKHPAAYFAKHAANLCSRDRKEMWQESRHAHLVAFDPRQRRLAGMALMNFEVVPALQSKRKSLIIRAINPMDEMLATHTEASIVESLLDVAIQIAERNNLAAVLMPWHKGAHLLSNLHPIEKYIEKQYLNKAQTHYVSRTFASNEEATDVHWRVKPRKVDAQFSAYEEGQEIVATLYAIWCGHADSMEAQIERDIVEEPA